MYKYIKNIYKNDVIEVGMAMFTNTSAKSIETRQWLYDKANHTEVAYTVEHGYNELWIAVNLFRYNRISL